MSNSPTFSAFAGTMRLARGPLHAVVGAAKKAVDGSCSEPVLVFEDHTGAQIDFDWRGTEQDVLERLQSHPLFAATEVARAGPGRPKLGVRSREVSLLPRHWEWLEEQPGGISVALRKLVDDARRTGPSTQLARRARDATGKFMWALAGNFPHFEEASRALYAGNLDELRRWVAAWPEGVRDHVLELIDPDSPAASADSGESRQLQGAVR